MTFTHHTLNLRPGRRVAATLTPLVLAVFVLSGAAALVLTAGIAVADIDVPTGAPPSPLFGAQPFTQQMLRFEEFGPSPMPAVGCDLCPTMPMPATTSAAPLTTALDAFLLQDTNPMPTEETDLTLANPWQPMIESMTGPLATTYMDGRPGGPLWGHQRWTEFFPEVYFQSAQAGARPNGGMRDGKQRHGYALGEFAPGGLYYNTAGVAGFEGTTAGVDVRFHPNMPIQDHRALWTFDGTFPPKLLLARYDEPVLFRHYNALPIDPAENFGFGVNTITTHEHNGHNPAESDGFAAAFFFPGQFYDYHWPMVLAGRDRINTDASDPRAGTPDGNGGIQNVRGDWRETMSTHWFHDHMLDFTAQNVYKGNAAMFNMYSAIDRGHEDLACHYDDPDNNVNLCLPSGTALDWGNRDYDVNLALADKAWDASGQLFFNIFNLDGFLGDRMTVNWLYKPYFEVRARRYRFRILNASVSRYFKIAIVDQSGKRIKYHLVANDGNVLEHSVPYPNAEATDLPVQGIAERYDIVIDFSQFQPGDKLYFVNLLEHDNGRRPKEEIPLAEILSGAYVADGVQGDPVVGKFMELRVVAYDGDDTSMDPTDYEPGKMKMIPLPTITPAEVATARHRTFTFGRSNGSDEQPWTIKTDGGQGLGMDPARQSAAPDEGTLEIWHIENGGGGWSHPVHIHFEEGRILQRGGAPPPIWERYARKDVYRIGRMPDSTSEVIIALRFREFLGTYMEHCHNTQHEDHAMLLRWDIENPGQTIAMPAPFPTWEGVLLEDTFEMTTSKTGDVVAAAEWDPTIGVDGGSGPPTTLPGGGDVVCGDVSGDGALSISDALMAAQYQVGLRSCGQMPGYEWGDIDEDGSCTIVDALKMAQCEVGLIGCDFACPSISCSSGPN